MKRFLCALAALMMLSMPLVAISGPPPKKALPPAKVGPPPCPPGGPAIPFDPLMIGPMPFAQGPGLTARVDARGGYMWLNQIASFPFDNLRNPNDPGGTTLGQFLFDGMTLTLADANVWVGFLGLDLDIGDRLLAYGQIGANIPRDARVIMNFNGELNGFGGANTVSPWEWTAQNFHWWMLDVGGGIRLGDAYAIVAGFRTEHIDYRMIDPRNNTHEERGPASELTQAIICDRL